MLLLRQGYQVSKIRLYRLYRGEGLSLRYRPNRKRRAQMSRPARAKSTVANQAWNKVEIAFSRPGKPTDNAFVESFNGTLRDECPNAHWVTSLADAREQIERSRVEYNESRSR